ncbi:helix-turn-helix domain-containing protein [Haloarchaeobius sp. HRN-SO-5]|uniref:helix-turn-helix domain-containing protein n=1 Tax=Haloarchaeobius sp. HRN-SO-5 TaxID=3446118 RepID=UPI003EB76ACE
MSANQAPHAELTDDSRLHLPDGLETERSKLVYLTLAVEGEGTPRGIARALRLRAMEVYPVLGSLVANGLVKKRGNAYEIAGGA